MSSFKSVNLLAIIWLATSLTVKDFKPAFFHYSQPSAFFNVDTGSPANGEILCFADINGDKYTDYIATDNRNGTTLIVYYWSDVQTKFSKGYFTISNPKGDYLAQVIVTDLNADSTLELLATFSNNGVYYSQIYTIKCPNSCTIFRWEIDYTLLTSMTAVPFPLDRVSNGTVHIFTFRNSTRFLVTCVANDKKLYSQKWSTFLGSDSNSFQVVNTHFAAQVDINGDCFADLVMVSGASSNILQMYIKNSINNYVLRTLDFKKTITWMTAADLDANGAIDLFLVFNQAGNYNPYVLPNVNNPVDICLVYPSPPYSINKMIGANLPTTHKINKDSNIKIGDFNFDGYPDLLGIFSLNSFRTVSILANMRQFKFNNFQVNLSELQQINNPIQTSLYDFTQNGKLDIIIISQVTKDDGSLAYVRTSIINNIIDDTLFIKVLPLLPSSSDLSSNALVGGFAITIQWRLTNLDGDKTINVMNQKSQWNYGSLQLPFATTGLGRTNNYIQDLTVGYPGYGVSSSWTPIIPNSQLIVVQQGGEWELQTLLKDNSRVYSMIYVSVLCLLVMGVLIFFLNWKQRQEDKRDHYNFIHMIR